ncbi:MAG: alpha-amylase family glycosyl hydrolase [Acidobacteriaceae bacterium]
MMEFHISRVIRDRYQVRDVLFNFAGNVIFGDVSLSRELAKRINQVRGTANDPEKFVHPGALFAMGLIDEVSHALIAHYRKNYDPAVMTKALAWFESRVGRKNVNRLLHAFVEEFPNVSIYRGQQTVAAWLRQSTEGMPHREVALEEMMLLWLANTNPAFAPFKELFDDRKLANSSVYPKVTASLGEYFTHTTAIAVPGQKAATLLDLLRAPMLAAPDSLSGQLAYIRQSWTGLLGDSLRRVLLAVDVLQEEDLAIWMRFHPPSAMQQRQQHDVFSKHAEVPSYGVIDSEDERFSHDLDWMPSVVMIAKSTYVWLAQLSRQYGRAIERLDQIPDEELDLLASRGLNALWLIGIWERSQASKTIKRLCGQPDAVASAYSLASYEIANDLGGEYAYNSLRDRAAARGIKLASDMVPNHMGIDSTWVIEHPEWFLTRQDSPYPAYRFDGPDLSHDPRVEIKIEGHYYEQSDAAVVFRRRDTQTGHIDYIYHGNDGTSFPWNDTAQLNYLKAEVREGVIQTILHVARLFPIIRFDAAMTLARKHIQRLWFPLPGSGGAIPSRAESSMTQAEFDALIPHEFWREVVDRVAAEVPDTLLLAEAFWLMEGYFVRTLGMHRVYNSAFMHMLRDEDNSKYRLVLKNTLEFDPDILKRYVNFMSNPDERTAIDQFGTGDKYFGVCTLMATLPGLPMFGHGQIEAFTEKYGMEYRWPRYEEQPNEGLVARHQQLIAPLLKRRPLFAESHNFVLYDFWREDGTVDENVFAYSNRLHDQRALVIYHNRFAHTRGSIHHSAAYSDKVGGGLHRSSLQEALQLPSDKSVYLSYRDHMSGLEYLHRSNDLDSSGLMFELHAYQCRVLLNWRELRPDADHPWDRLYDALRSKGVPDIDEALVNLQLQPVYEALQRVLDIDLIRKFADLANATDEDNQLALRNGKKPISEEKSELMTTLVNKCATLFAEVNRAFRVPALHAVIGDVQMNARELATTLKKYLEAAMKLSDLESEFKEVWPAAACAVLPRRHCKQDRTTVWASILGWSVVRTIADVVTKQAPNLTPIDIFDSLRLRAAFAGIFIVLGMEKEASWQAAARIRTVLLPMVADPQSIAKQMERLPLPLWSDQDVHWLTGLHDAEGALYFWKEAYEELLWWMALPELMSLAGMSALDRAEIQKLEAALLAATSVAEEANYNFDVLFGEPEIVTPLAMASLEEEPAEVSDAE